MQSTLVRREIKSNTGSNTLFVSIMIGVLFSLLIFGATTLYYTNIINDIKAQNSIALSEVESEKYSILKSYNTVNYLYTEEQKSNQNINKELRDTKTELSDLKSQIYVSKQREKQVSRGDYANKDLSQYEIFTVNEFNEWIDERAPEGSPFIGKGEFFLKLSAQINTDPKFIVGLAAQESGWGMSSIARDKNNYFGIGAFNETPYSSSLSFSDGVEEGLAEGANWIKLNYYNQGQKTLNLMIYGDKAYCVDDSGMPAQSWINGISNIIYK